MGAVAVTGTNVCRFRAEFHRAIYGLSTCRNREVPRPRFPGERRIVETIRRAFAEEGALVTAVSVPVTGEPYVARRGEGVTCDALWDAV
jgi:hypothetical protein